MCTTSRFAALYPVVLAACLATGAGCKAKDGSEVKTTTQIANERMDKDIEEGFPFLDDMADNAILHNMAIADFHFVPHTAEISGTGAARLDRLAPMLDTYGGTLRYETYLTDEALVTERLKHVREYLALAGCNMDRVQIKPMISGGRTTPAAEAIRNDIKGTAKSSGAPASAAASPAAPTSN